MIAFLLANTRWIAAGFLLMLFSSFGQTFFIGLSGNDLRAVYGLTEGGFGLVYMVATLASSLTLPWAGRTLDVMPGWKVALFSMPALAGACILLPLSPNVFVLTFAIYLLRLFGQGMMTEIALTETGRWFVANRGRAMALVVQGQQAGTAILPALLVLVTRTSGDWRTGWFAGAAVLVLVALPLIVWLMRTERKPHSTHRTAQDQRTARDWTQREVLRDPVLYVLLAGTLAPSFIGTAIFFHQGYLIALRGYDPLAFAAAYPLMSVTTVVFGLVCGSLIDRFGALKLLPFFLIPLCVASLALALVTPVWGIYLFMTLLGVSSGFTSTLLGALWPEVYGTANLGGIRAITVSAMVLSSAIGPGLTGALIDAGIPLPSQLLWLAGWCAASCGLLALGAGRIQLREMRALGTEAG